ncbi:MAG TPA: ScpA family protein [Acidimicrobiia bacterium]|jgi:segregation and condensation protein A|nr:ScpA family protein [Acidimicrobiia bacterium]
MGYEVKTRVFEGPLDLLLQLIMSHQVDITELSLGRLVTEYVEHLDAMRDLDLDVTSEFLLIAATLIQLKARHLLPGDADVDIDEELALAEERDRLLARLLACLTFKDVAAVLAHRMEGNARYVPRMAGLDPDITPAPPEFRLGVGPAELAAIAARAFNRPFEEPELDHLELDLPSVDDAIVDLRRRLSGEAVAEFDALVAHCKHPMQVIAYFLAILELARWGIVQVDQEHAGAAITVAHDPDAQQAVGDIETEWS